MGFKRKKGQGGVQRSWLVATPRRMLFTGNRDGGDAKGDFEEFELRRSRTLLTMW